MVFIETDRLRLRNLELKDANEMVDYRNNIICSRYQRGQTKEYEKIVDLIRRRKEDNLSLESPTMLAVALKDSDNIVGEIVVMPSEGTISLGYTFSYKIHRHGFAYEALFALLDHLHLQYPEWDYVCFTCVENVPSIGLLKKLGFKDMGYLSSKDSQVFGKWLRDDTEKEISEAVEQGFDLSI